MDKTTVGVFFVFLMILLIGGGVAYKHFNPHQISETAPQVVYQNDPGWKDAIIGLNSSLNATINDKLSKINNQPAVDPCLIEAINDLNSKLTNYKPGETDQHKLWELLCARGKMIHEQNEIIRKIEIARANGVSANDPEMVDLEKQLKGVNDALDGLVVFE